VPLVFLLVGLTGAGKTTYSRRVLEPAGAVRLSVDELIYERHGQYDVDYPADTYFSLYEPAVQEIRERMVREVALGHDVALDLGIWSRTDRDEWKDLIEKAGGQWRLLYFPVSHAELLSRLAHRNRMGGADAMPLRETDLDDFYTRFDEPENEGEEVIQPGSY
jgi:predicted kinase